MNFWLGLLGWLLFCVMCGICAYVSIQALNDEQARREAEEWANRKVIR